MCPKMIWMILVLVLHSSKLKMVKTDTAEVMANQVIWFCCSSVEEEICNQLGQYQNSFEIEDMELT